MTVPPRRPSLSREIAGWALDASLLVLGEGGSELPEPAPPAAPSWSRRPTTGAREGRPTPPFAPVLVPSIPRVAREGDLDRERRELAADLAALSPADRQRLLDRLASMSRVVQANSTRRTP